MALRRSLKFGLNVLNLWPFVPVASRAPVYGRLLFELVRDDRVPWESKALLGLAAAYVASPIDLIPDVLPVIGRMDDLAIAVISVDLFLESIPRPLMLEKMYSLGIDGRELERDLESIRRAVPRPVRLVIKRLPDIFDQATAAVRSDGRRMRGMPAQSELKSRARRRRLLSYLMEECSA